MAESGIVKLFNKLRIRKALTQARTISIDRSQVNSEFLVSRWSTEIHTFAASCGEFGPSLEDLAVLISLQLFGDAHAIGVILSADDQKRSEFLNKALSDSRYPSSKATYLSWVKLFEEGERRNKLF